MPILPWLRNPQALYHRLRYYVWEKMNPGAPWLCPGTVAFCRSHLTKQSKVLEYGSGRSTRWFAERVASIISVEHNTEWHGIVSKKLAGLDNVDYRLVPLSHPESEPEQAAYDPLPPYVSVASEIADGSLNLVVVDGHYRSHCIRCAAAKIAPGGWLLVDDVNFWPSIASIPAPAGWSIADDSTNGIKRCIIWQRPA